MTTHYDDLPIEVRRDRFGWFGVPWWSYTCFDEGGRLLEEMRKPFPQGERCLYCEEPFDEAAGDSGQATPYGKADGTWAQAHVHKECQFRMISGGLAHHEGRCRCHGGDADTPGMTLREEALEIWRRLRQGTLYAGAGSAGGDHDGKDQVMGERTAAEREAGYEVEARCSIVFGTDALLEVPGEDEAVPWPAGEVAAALGVDLPHLAGKVMAVTVRESAESGRVLSGFRLV